MVFRPEQIKEPTIVAAGREPVVKEERRLELEKELKEKEIFEAERAYRRGLISIRDLIAPSALKITPRYFQLGGKFLRTIFVVSYPRSIFVGWFAPIINFPVPIDIAIYLYPVQAAVILKQLLKKVGNLQAEITAEGERGMPRDPLRETAIQDIEKLRDDLTTGIEHFFQVGLYLTIYSSTEKDLDLLTERIENIFGSQQIFTRRAFYQTEQGFNSTLPLGNDELMVVNNLNSSPAASSFPFVSADLSSDNGILYGINRHNNSLILFDRFSLQNANMTVFATSGAGKSYAIKLEVLRSMMLGVDIIIIDPEREYKYLSDAVGGTYINISLGSENKINPFDLPRPVGGEVKVGDLIRSAVIALKGLLKLMIGQSDSRGNPQFTPEEDSLTDQALLETYNKKDITPSCDLTKVEMPVLSDLQEVLERMEGGASLAERLKKYTQGTFAGLLNHPTNVKTDNQLVVFSVRDLEDELRPLAIYTIVNYIWNIVRSELKKRIMVIDEAWWLMQHEDSAKFIFSLVKRARKYYLGVTTITQDVSDFLTSAYGGAIVKNSALQLLLKQTPAAIDLVSQTFMLTQGERTLLLECGVGEGIFFAGTRHAAIKVEASYTEDQLITTDPRQILEIEQAKKEFARSLEKGESEGLEGMEIE